MAKRIHASGGTDGANIVLFWPDNLPDDADAWLQEDPIELVEQMCADGKLIWFPCDGDGNYHLSIFVDGDVPDDLMAVCTDPEQYLALVVKGTAWFGGMEYMFKHDDRFLRKYPHMCERVDIPDGIYMATVWQTNLSDELNESFIRARVSSKAKRIGEIHSTLAALSVVGVMASLISALAATWMIWLPIVVATAILIGSAIAITRTESYQQVAQARSEFNTSYPSYVVALTSQAAPAG